MLLLGLVVTMAGSDWMRYETWRRHPMLNNNLRHAFPGLGIAIVAFAGYVAYDKLTSKGPAHH